jgi:hypothetical protein
MRRLASWIVVLLLILSRSSWAAPKAASGPIVPTPPELVLDKQLPGEDPYWIYRPTFSPDNKYVAAFMSSSKTITIWDTATAKVVKEIPDSVHQMDALDGLEFSNDGKQLLLLRNSQPLRYLDWNAAKVTREVALNADPKKILDYAFNPSQSLLAVGTYTGVKLYDLRAGKQIKQYCQGVPICGLDMLEYTNRQGKLVRVLAYAKALMPPEQSFKNVAGLINLDSGAVIPLLNDVPADKRIDNKMTFFRVKFEWGGSYLLIAAYVIPPTNHAIAYLVDTSNGKYISSEQLGQLTLAYDEHWLGKPYYGFLMATADMSQAGGPYKIATQFVVPTRKEGLKVIDTVDQETLAVQSISLSRNRNWAAVTVKKDQMDPSKLYLYKLVPKKR